MVSRVARAIEFARLTAEVVHGFGRGSKLLGFPTANMKICWGQEDALTPEESEVLKFASSSKPGIYYGWAKVVGGDDEGVYKTAMSVGWNPHFEDSKVKTIEAWILHDYAEDFHGKELRVIICGYIREEAKFESLEALIDAIQGDGDFCSQQLDHPTLHSLTQDSWFVPANKVM